MSRSRNRSSVNLEAGKAVRLNLLWKMTRKASKKLPNREVRLRTAWRRSGERQS